MKRVVLALVFAGLFLLAACQGSEGADSAASGDGKSRVEESGAGAEAGSNDEMFTVGIIQFAQHGSLDNCREGFIQGMEEAGFVEGENVRYDYQNADADMALVSQISDAFISKKVDLIVAIATPAATGAFNSAMHADIPVVYSAVTDPVEAQLADEEGNSLGNATGTSDILPVEAQLAMIREILPEAKKLGILYTTSEANSLSMIRQYEELVGDYGFELVAQPVSVSADIPLAADNLLTKVDAITNLLDNTVVNSLPIILEKANEKGIPVFGSEIEQVKIGCLAAEGVEYISLGQETGRMAAEILSGKSTAADMPYRTVEDANLYLNQEVAELLGIELDQSLLERATELFTEIQDPNQ